MYRKKRGPGKKIIVTALFTSPPFEFMVMHDDSEMPFSYANYGKTIGISFWLVLGVGWPIFPEVLVTKIVTTSSENSSLSFKRKLTPSSHCKLLKIMLWNLFSKS